MTDITAKDLHELVEYFSKNTYRAKDADSTSQAIMQRCILLADLDYTHSIINNNNGDLSAHYPSHLIILEYEKHRNLNVGDTPPPVPRTTETIYESIYDISKLKDMMKNARFARCRSRFPLPVILFKGRHICRSATLSGGPEIYGRSGLEYFFASTDSATVIEQVEDTRTEESSMSDWQLFDKVRHQDIKLLKTLNVETIIDFMVEKKKVKFGMNVTSSEKVDKEQRYSEFTLISLPYPGCEFFKEFREHDYTARGLVFDWTQTHVDAQIGVPDDSISSQLHIKWEQYKGWDLVKLTQNYFKLILRYLTDSSSGMLIHCISGWDRTPLFISMLRISLWADGMVHTTLNAEQLLYYTIAYDWMLFGHDLHDRQAKGEEIFYFCFHFLKHIKRDEFSIKRHGNRHTVFRNDSDSQLDNIFEGETGVPLSSVSSNLSLNSSCSNISQNSRDSQDNLPPSIFHVSADGSDEMHSNGNVIPWFHHSPSSKDNSSSAQGSRSPLPNVNRTSPVAVPNANRTSPVAVPNANRTSPVPVPVPVRVRQRNESSSSGGSWQLISGTGSLRGSTSANAPTLADGLPCTSNHAGHASQESSATVVGEDNHQTKRERNLDNLRTLFMNAYSQSVGLKMKDTTSDANKITQMLGNFAEKVGIYSSVQRTSL